MERKKKTLLVCISFHASPDISKWRMGGDLRSNNSNGKTSSLQFARCVQAREYGRTTIALRNSVSRIGIPAPERRVHVSPTVSITTSCRIRHIDEGSAESEIEQHAQEGEEGNAAETAYQQKGEDRIQDAGAGDAFYGSDVGVDVQTMVVQCG